MRLLLGIISIVAVFIQVGCGSEKSTENNHSKPQLTRQPPAPTHQSNGDSSSPEIKPGSQSHNSSDQLGRAAPQVPRPAQLSDSPPASGASENNIPNSSVELISRLIIPGMTTPVGFKLNDQKAVVWSKGIVGNSDFLKAEYDVSALNAVTPKSLRKIISVDYRTPFTLTNNGVAFGPYDYGSQGTGNDLDLKFLRYDFATDASSNLMFKGNFFAVPILDDRTGDIWQFSPNGMIKFNRQTLRMPPIKPEDFKLTDNTYIYQSPIVKFDPDARVVLWYGFHYNGASRQGARVIVGDLKEKKNHGPFILRETTSLIQSGENRGFDQIAWKAEVLPHQREFVVLGNNEKGCLGLNVFSYSGQERSVPTINSILGSVCNVRADFPPWITHDRTMLKRFGDEGLIIMVFKNQVVTADTKNDKILSSSQIIPVFEDQKEFAVGEYGEILLDKDHPQVFAVNLIINIRTAPNNIDSRRQLHIFQYRSN